MIILLKSYISKYWPWIIGAIIPLSAFLIYYPHYLRNNTFFWISVATLPLSMSISGHKGGREIFYLAVVTAIISLALPTIIGVYVLLCMLLVVLIQSFAGRLQYTLIIHCLLISPLFTYFSSLVSFPVRLHLSRAVTSILHVMGLDIQLEGNLVHYGDTSFLVDEACAGMFMLGYGLLFGTIIISYFTKYRRLKISHLIAYYAILFSLIVMGNIARITWLILFQIMPDHWLHEGLGLMIYLFQILLPFYIAIQFFTKKKLKIVHHSHQSIPRFPKWQYASLCVLLVLVSTRQQYKQNQSPTVSTIVPLAGYKSEFVKGDVLKLKNDQSLIYIKPPVAPYRADHNPMICWLGSGYSFKKIDKWPIKEMTINHAELVKGEDKIYTAWWFQSPSFQTGDQLLWRKYGLLHNEDFYLINVTCNTKEELVSLIQQLTTNNILQNSIKSIDRES